MKIDVRDAAGTLIATGVMTELGPIFSPNIPEPLHMGFTLYLAENPHKKSGTFDGDVDGKHYFVSFES